jgi:hypothetical protein
MIFVFRFRALGLTTPAHLDLVEYCEASEQFLGRHEQQGKSERRKANQT